MAEQSAQTKALVDFREYAVRTIQPAIAQILPRSVSPERMVKVLLSCVNRNDKLLQCSKASFVRALMQAGELGLELGGMLGEAWLIPYKRSWKEGNQWKSEMEAQCQLGFQGYLSLARRNRDVLDICARAVYEGDLFDIDVNASTPPVHKPLLRGDRGDLICVYAFTRLRGGIVHIEPPMTIEDIEGIRMRSKTYNDGSTVWSDGTKPGENNGPWSTDYVAMAIKSILRRHCKYIPRSVELGRALQVEADNESDGAPPPALILDAAPDRPMLGAKPAGPVQERLAEATAATAAQQTVPAQGAQMAGAQAADTTKAQPGPTAKVEREAGQDDEEDLPE